MLNTLKLAVILSVPFVLNQGCSDPPPAAKRDATQPPAMSSSVPDIAAISESVKPSPAAPPRLAISAQLQELLTVGTPKAKRNAGKQLGQLLTESRQRPLEKRGETLADRRQLQAEILKKLGSLGPLAIEAIPAFTAILQGDGELDLKQQVLELAPKLGSTGKRMGSALAGASRDENLRSSAIAVIAQLECDDSASVGALGQALRDEKLREIALVALSRFKGPVATPASRFLVELAVSPEAALASRIAAIEVLGKINRTGIPELFYDKDLSIRKAVAHTGAFTGSQLVLERDPEVITAAFQGLARPPLDSVRLAGIFDQVLKNEALRPHVQQFLKQHPDKVVEILFQLFKSNSALVRDACIDLLAELELSPPVTASLEQLLHESDDLGVIALAAIKLGQSAPNEDPLQFAEIIGKWISHPKLSAPALTLLSKLGAPAIPTLTAAIVDSRFPSTIKSQVLDALALQSDVVTAALPILQTALKAEDASSRQWAVLTHLRLVGENASESPAELELNLKESLKTTDVILLRSTLEALANHPKLATRCYSELRETLKHSSTEIRVTAIRTLIKTANDNTSPLTLEAIRKLSTDDPDLTVRKTALEALK